jgi:hypothetical protein
VELELQQTPSAYPHLSTKAAAVADGDIITRRHFLQEAHWIGYSAALAILERKDFILKGPRVDRMESMLIVGETNNGKTRIIRRFMDQHPPMEMADGNIERQVLCVQAPPVPDEKRLYGSILSRVGSPGSSWQSAGSQYQIVEKVLRGVGLKMLVIDEIQHLVSGSTNKHKDCLNALKYLANDLQISLVGAGIKTAHYALANWDQQLENRFLPCILPRWTFGPELARLLKSMEQLLPLRKPSNLDDPKIVQRVADLGDGKIGEIWTLMCVAAFKAMEGGKELIDIEIIKQAESIAPAHRRALLHGIE